MPSWILDKSGLGSWIKVVLDNAVLDKSGLGSWIKVVLDKSGLGIKIRKVTTLFVFMVFFKWYFILLPAQLIN
jgi:hypothetical protein